MTYRHHSCSCTRPLSNGQQISTNYSFFLPRCMECRRGLAMRIPPVCPSVRPSVKCVNCDKTKEKSVHIFRPYERSFILVFLRKRMIGGGDHFYLKFWVNPTDLRLSEIADFEQIIARSASAVTLIGSSSVNNW